MTKPISIGLLLLTAALTSEPAQAADEGMPGKLLLVKPGILEKFIAKPPTGDLFSLPSGASDPTVGGGELRFFKGDRADTFALPVQAAPQGWKGLGSPAGVKGFKYRGAGTTTDPCKVVLVKEKMVKGVCRGIRVRLDPPAPGPVGILLTVGATPKTYLALYGGTELKNTAELLKRKNAPAPPACDCGATTPTEFRFANGAGSGVCGNVTDGTTTKNFDCGKLVVGGGNSPVPASVFQDMVDETRLKVRECTGKNLILEATSVADTGSIRQCTEPNCLFAAPLPIVLPSVPQSACVYMRVDRAGRGTVQCDSGDASIDMEILGAMFLTGDILPRRCSGGSNPGARCGGPFDPMAPAPLCPGGTCDIGGAPCETNGDCGLNGPCNNPGVCTLDPAVQPCPICNPTTLVCNGGNNNNGMCAPGSQLVSGAPFPTSHDCTVSTLVFIGDIPIPFELSTGTTVRKTFASAGQSHVFCGYCRDADSSLCFEGDPDTACPVGGQLHPCSSDDECAQPFEACQQRSNGGFGPAGGSFTTATEIGTPAGSLEDFAPHAGTLSGIFCIPPTYGALVDGSSDLPGPGAVALSGTLQLSPGGAFIDGAPPF